MELLVLPLILGVPLTIFVIGYAIGMAAFAKSPKRQLFAVICGFATVAVVALVGFAGCVMLLSHMDFK